MSAPRTSVVWSCVPIRGFLDAAAAAFFVSLDVFFAGFNAGARSCLGAGADEDSVPRLDADADADADPGVVPAS